MAKKWKTRADHVLIRIIEGFETGANPGETIGVPVAKAESLVAHGFAVFCNPPEGFDRFGHPLDEDRSVPLPVSGSLQEWRYGR